MSCEKERAQKGSFGRKDDELARNMGGCNQVFEEMVMWTSSLVWLCERWKTNLELLEVKLSKKKI